MAGFADIARKAAAESKNNSNNKNEADAAAGGGGTGAGNNKSRTLPLSPTKTKSSTNKVKNVAAASPRKSTTAGTTTAAAAGTRISGGNNKPSFAAIATTAAAKTKAGGSGDGEKEKRSKAADSNWTKATTAVKIAAVADKNRRTKENQKLAERTLVSATAWEFFSPPPTNSIKGKVVPRVLNRYQNRRKLSIEVHKVTPLMEDQEQASNGGSGLSAITGMFASSDDKPAAATTRLPSYEECVCRILVAPSKKLNREYRAKALMQQKSSAEEYNEDCSFHFDDGDDDDDDDDDSSVASTTNADGVRSVEASQLADHGGKDYDGWKPRYAIPIDAIHIRQHHKKTANILITYNKVRQERDIVFDTLEDSKKFVLELDRQQRLEAERQEDRLKATLGDIVLPPLETVNWLVEVVSGYDLPIGDFKTSDPYVVCMLGNQEVHRTKHISSTLDPIWTLKTGSLFLMEAESKRLFLEDGLKFIIRDYDQIGKDEVLGIVQVKPRIVYQSKGERMEFKLQPPHGSRTDEVPGYLVIRIRRATFYDEKFMADYKKSHKEKGVVSYDHPKATTNFVKTMTTFNKKKDKDGTIRYKIRPSPDPKREDETTYMTDEDLRSEVMKPSQQWLDIGEGGLGRIHVEILGCEGLPNMDTGGFLGNKTDAFVSVVYEDAFARTEVIDDCLSPQYMPWTQRAFILHMAHPSSILNVAVFDFDSGLLDDHDLIGRVSVDVSALLPDTEYLLKYNLNSTNRVADRSTEGQITIRVRIEVDDERKLALAALEPPPAIYVNAKKRRDFRVIRETCLGNIDEERYSVATLKSYVDELQELQYALFYLQDAAMTLFLWRGHFEVNVFGREIELPLHSLNAFFLFTFLVEHPQLFPSFCFLSIAWILLAVMGWRRNSENIWQHCYSYLEILRMVAVGDSMVPPAKIEPYENFDNAKKEMEDWVNRIEEAAKKAERAYAEAEIEEKERQQELEEIGEADNDIGTKTGGGGISIDPVRAALYPIQLMLGMLCRVIRFIKNVIIWQEAFFSFWICTCCIILSVICAFVPWLWIIKWTSRLIVWTIFGPWMKLVDVFYVSQLKPETEEERKIREKAEKLQRKLATTEAAHQARQVRENAAKMKVMKKYYFGKFSMQVPILKQDRYIDIPLPESTAVPHKEKQLDLAELAMEEAGYNRKRLPGQTLVGEMIPTVAADSFTQAPVGKATAHPERLAKGVPGAADRVGGDSTTSAYMKITAVVIAAIGISYFSTPMIVGIFQSIVGVSTKADEL